MAIEQVTPREAHAQREADPALPYLDVRSIPEFEQGHPAGAFNIPLMHFNAVQQGLEPNPDFERVVQAAFPPERPIIVGCQMGGRSLRAAQVMAQLGFQELRNVAGGFGGGEDEYGEPVEGWLDAGLPVARVAEPAHDYDTLQKATG